MSAAGLERGIGVPHALAEFRRGGGADPQQRDSHPDAADGTAAMLDALYGLPADTTRASLWTTAQTAVAPLLAPAARDTFIPGSGEATDLDAFIRAGGTCYLLADERRASALAPVVSAFADDFIETAKTIADTLPGGRLDPPLGLFLDEVANIVPLPQLPALMSFAGGTGVFVTAVLQSMAQARNRWGHDAAAMLWERRPASLSSAAWPVRTCARSPSWQRSIGRP
jgi:type IV secretion system protein VirD4